MAYLKRRVRRSIILISTILVYFFPAPQPVQRNHRFDATIPWLQPSSTQLNAAGARDDEARDTRMGSMGTVDPDATTAKQ